MDGAPPRRRQVQSRWALISDTHGVLTDAALAYLRSLVDSTTTNSEPKDGILTAILHAGDVGDKRASRLQPRELLQKIAWCMASSHDNNLQDEHSNVVPIFACRGNVDDDIPDRYSHSKDQKPRGRLPHHVVHIDPRTGVRILILHGDGIPHGARIQNSTVPANNSKKKNRSQAPARSVVVADHLVVSKDAWTLIRKERAQVVLHGHSHLVGCTEQDGVLFVNPGSAGPKRFGRPATCGSLTLSLDGDNINGSLVESYSSSSREICHTSRGGAGKECTVVSYRVQIVDIDNENLLLDRSGQLQVPSQAESLS